jgi:mycofactocin system glycosyltransferase
LVVGGWPPRCVRLSAAGAAALDQALAGDPPPPHAAGLLERLLAHGMLDPLAAPAEAELTFVIPARDGGPALAALVGGLTVYGPVIVVDDGSGDGSPELAREAGATVVANREGEGPAGARNTGWRLAQTEFVAFVDADCRVGGDWARPLAALLAADGSLALAAPRVRGAEGPGWLARWERSRSPLDMGAAGGLVGPGRRVAYVPSAALVARRAALVELDGFDDGLRFGEDVDLVWRAVATGWSARYAPEVEVRHPARATVRGRTRQHFEYGTSAAALEQRHPGAAVPLRPSRMMLPAALLAGGSAGGALLAAAAIAAAAASRQSDRRAGLAVARLALGGELAAGRSLARALSREWLPLTLLALARPGRARRFALAALATDVAAATAPDPAAAPANALLRLADNAAYCAGLWRGALSRRSARALLP